ncbi:Ras-GEF domain-containing family member 1B-B [Bagarius yarrelli]|uniref:Ras-GEF domain-containing family member 1B-B n=1 Tax=Bagarius yarrelli TaxID=175774 RepID=A0A556V9R8_BAGYA|nr:Ras-GEF domain-containing family member 1B-B [Bagarius yarrelli]
MQGMTRESRPQWAGSFWSWSMRTVIEPESSSLIIQVPSGRCGRAAPRSVFRMPQTTPFAAKFPQNPYGGGHTRYKPVEESYGGLRYHDNNLVSGSLEALIQHLVPTVDYSPDRSYIFTFLLSSRLFLHPFELMSRVCYLCVEHHRKRIRDIAPKIVQLLTEWTETFPYDFRDERMMRSLKEMTHRLAFGDELSRRAMQRLIQRLLRKLTILGQYEESLVTSSTPVTPSSSSLSVGDKSSALKAKQHIRREECILNVCDDPFILAQQLTHIEMERLGYIGPEEFVQAFVQKRPADNHKSFFSKRRVSNLEAYVEWFNRLSYLVATEICLIVIPFFSLFIKDIYFLNEGCASRLPNGHINFEKFWELAKQVSEFLAWRQVICPFERDRKTLQYLISVSVFTDDELQLASYESEGPENNLERDTRRSLRLCLAYYFFTAPDQLIIFQISVFILHFVAALLFYYSSDWLAMLKVILKSYSVSSGPGRLTNYWIIYQIYTLINDDAILYDNCVGKFHRFTQDGLEQFKFRTRIGNSAVMATCLVTPESPVFVNHSGLFTDPHWTLVGI